MIGENIKRARKAKNLSQEELAVRLNVVRQTVSKWENSLSVPDADILIQMAELLGVSAGQLLGVELREDAEQELAQRLARLNEELAACARRERMAQRVNKKRGALFAIVALHQNAVITLSEENTKTLVMACVAAVMLFFGFISPKLPFNRYTGLRLPWTVRDEETWNVAHKILGYLSLPLVLLYLAACWTAGDATGDFGLMTMCVLLLWIGIPGGMSLIFFWKKTHGRLA